MQSNIVSTNQNLYKKKTPKNSETLSSRSITPYKNIKTVSDCNKKKTTLKETYHLASEQYNRADRKLKLKKYQGLTREQRKQWNIKFKIVLIIDGILATVIESIFAELENF